MLKNIIKTLKEEWRKERNTKIAIREWNKVNGTNYNDVLDAYLAQGANTANEMSEFILRWLRTN